MDHTENPMAGLTERQLKEKLNVKINFKAEAMEPTDDSFYMDCGIEYRNMDRLQFSLYEVSLLRMWENMNKLQVAVHMPEIND